MLPIQYTYLLGASLFLIPWIITFIIRKDLKILLFEVGILFSVLGLIGEYFWWTKDWWKPYTITHTVIGIEDIILGFGSAGVAATIYLVLFKKKFIDTKVNKSKRIIMLGIILISHIVLFAILFRMGINSFICTLITMFSVSLTLLFHKKELIIPAIISGILMTILVIPIYLTMIFVTFSVIQDTWMTKNLLGIYFLNVPVEDYIFYFLTGVVCFSVYPFYNDSKLKSYNLV